MDSSEDGTGGQPTTTTQEDVTISPTDEPETEIDNCRDDAEKEDPVATEEQSILPDETDEVIRILQQLVTLPRLNTAVWSDEARVSLRHFVEERSDETLCVTLVGEQLMASSGPLLPPGVSSDSPHVVFFKLVSEPLTKEKLHLQVGHFSVPGHAGEAVLRVLESGFAQPFIFNNKTWPLSMKTRLCSLLHQLFGELGRTQYEARGLTLLYIPTEGICNTSGVQDEEEISVTLGRLEEAVSRWYEQVSTAITTEQLGVKLPLVTDLVAFWNTKYENMCFLEQQLLGEAMQQIIPILETAQSDAARLLKAIIAMTAESKHEAESNKTILSALVDPSNAVSACSNLSAELIPLAVTLINTARVVWLHSLHFNSRSRVTQLFTSLSQQIIDVCIRTVNLRWIFKGRPVYGIARVSECITVCHDYMNTYEEIADMHRKHTTHEWDINSQEIFSSIYTFINRCTDLKEICEAMIIFGRVNEKESIRKPQFSGTNASHFSEICESIMRTTKKEVELLAQRKQEILDVTCTTWQQGMDRFRQQMTKVERRVVALTHAVMEKTTTVEDALTVLGAMNHYLQKPSLHNLLEEKSNMAYDLLKKNIDSVSNIILGGETLGYENLPPYSGAAMVARCHKNHLECQLKMLTESKYLAEKCERRDAVTREYLFITEVLDEATQEYYDRWAAAALAGDWEARLRRPLLTNSPVVPGAIETTLSREVLETLAEARVWQTLGFKPPHHVRELCNQEDVLNELRDNMMTICKMYNASLATLTDSEKCLFKEYILKIDNNLNPAFHIYSWVTKLPPSFITKALQYVEEFKLTTAQFHEDCTKIVLCCRKITRSCLLDVQPECLYQTIKVKDNLRRAIKPQYECILKLLANIKRGLRHTSSAQNELHWINFVYKISDIVEEAVINTIRKEMQNFLNILTENPQILIHLKVLIKNNEITFEPAIKDISGIVTHTLDCIKRLTKVIPNIVETLQLVPKKKVLSLSSKIVKDQKCKDLQGHLNKAMERCELEMRHYAQSWEQLSWVWKTARDEFEDMYRSKKPVATTIAQDIDRMSSMLEDANISTSCVVLFLSADASGVRDTLISHVEGWRRVLLDLLLASTQSLAEKFHLDVDNDINKLLKEPTTLQDVAEKTIFCQIATVHTPCKESALKIVEEHKNLLAHYEIQIPQSLQQQLTTIQDKWNEYLNTIKSAKDSLEICQESFRSSLVDNGNALTRELTKVCSEVHKNGPFNTTWEASDAIEFLEATQKSINEIKLKKEEMSRDFELFGIESTPIPELTEIEKVLDVLNSIWETRTEWLMCWNKYKQCQFSNLETKELQKEVQIISKKLIRLSREPAREWPILEQTRKEVENLRHALPLVIQLRNPAMRQRHWHNVQTALKRHFDPKSDEFTLKEAMAIGITNFEEEIKKISNDANMEFKIETGLVEIAEIWQSMKLEFEMKSTSKLPRIKSVENICLLADEHLNNIAVMEASRYVSPFLSDVRKWKQKLTCVIDILEIIVSMQNKMLNIEPLLTIAAAFPDIGISSIKEICKEWKKMMITYKNEDNLITILCKQGYEDKIKDINNKIEEVNKEILLVMEKKCVTCPRLYFLSGHEKIRLLQNFNNLEKIRDILCKCLPGITDLRLGRQDTEVLGFCSATGEVLSLTEPILLLGSFDENILQLERAMKSAVQVQFARGCETLLRNPQKRDRWQRAFSLQVCVLASKIFWTLECTKTLLECEKRDKRKPLKLFKEDMQCHFDKLCETIKGKQSLTEKLKTAALLMNGEYELRIIDNLFDNVCKNTNSFEWLSQLRYYRSADLNTVEIRQMFGSFTHGLEYYGDPLQLVVTPQVDRCILHITTLLYLKMAGLMQGPSGCGKTEILRHLAMSLGRFLFVINCSKVINYLGLRSILTGIYQMGAWGVLRELLLLEERVLAVASLDLRQVLLATALGQSEVNLQGNNVKLHNYAVIFVTLNTKDERGNTDRCLPACLRPRFRPVAMRSSGLNLIIEIILLTEGVRNSKDYALKICRLFELCSLHLSKQLHYDFSARKIVHVAKQVGVQKRLAFKVDDEELILQTIMLEIAPQLLEEDRRIFLEYTSDLFPGVEAPVVDHRDLSIAIENAFRSANLMPLTWSVNKSLQLFEALSVRNCVLIVGASGSGKSTAWKMLSKALCKLRMPYCNQVQVYSIYPNSFTYSELYGEFNENSEQYHNGILSDKILELNSEDSGKVQWIVIDGEISEYWIDALMGILDNSRIMTTGNGERINISAKIKIIFESETLQTVPPSLLSLCSCIYFDHNKLGHRPYVDSWLHQHENKQFKNELSQLLSENLEKSLQFKDNNCKELITRTNLNVVQTLCQLLKHFIFENELPKSKNGEDQLILIKQWFYFCLTWSIFGAIQSEDRGKADTFVKDLEIGLYPADHSVFDYCVDHQWNGFVKWMDKFPNKFKLDPSIPIHKMDIPTLDLTRYSFIVSALITTGNSVLLTGHIGSGKSLVANYVLKALDKEIYSTIKINGTYERTRHSLIKMLERKLEKRSNDMLVPARGKKLVALLEDIGVTPRNANGAQPTLEALRQWREHDQWIDSTLKLFSVQGVQMVATLRHGESSLSSRLLRHFSLLEISAPCDTELHNLFMLPIAQHLLVFGEQIKLLGQVLVASSIELYRSVKSKLLATPLNSHYVFSMKNLTEVIQGLLLSNREYHNTKSAMCKLWIHENLRVYCDRISNLTDRLWFIREISRHVTNHYGLSTTVLCPGKRYPLFVLMATSLSDEACCYVETTSEDEQERLETLLAGSHAVMFREAAEHVARVVRVLSRPSSHLLLLGQAGCGRHALLKLACRVSHVQLAYAEVSRDPATQVDTFRQQVKILVRQAAVLGQPIALILSDSQVIQNCFLDIVNNIIQPGHIYDLFSDNEIEEIYNELGIMERGNCFDPDVASEYIEDKIQQKLHIILCFDLNEPNFRDRLKQFPSLASCAMDYFAEWSRDALLQVAKKYLTKLVLGDEQVQTEMKTTVANLFAQFHETVVQFVNNFNLNISITPAQYLDCLKTYTLLLNKKQLELKKKTEQLKKGLKKIEETKQSVELMIDELLRAQRCVLDRQRQCEAALVTLGQRRREVEEQSKVLESSAKQLALEETAAQQLARLAHAAMDEAVPALEDADLALDALNHKELLEMRAYGRPPDSVDLAMSAVLILKQSDPTWVEAKRQLADPNFIDQLQNFDKDHIPDKIMKSISTITSNPEFNPEKIGTVCVTAKHLAQWVLAIEKYARIYRVAAPKRAKLERASRELREHQAELSDIKSRLAHLKTQLEDQKVTYENSLQIRDTLNMQAEEMGARLQRANQLVSGLGNEEDTWRSHVEQSSSHEQLLIGDCLIVSAFLNYAGPFNIENRKHLQETLTRLVQEAEVKCTSDLRVAEYLVNKATVMEWQLQGLPRDNFSSDSAVIALQNTLIPSDTPSPLCRWPLLIDPQSLALNWLRSLKDYQKLRITDQKKKDFVTTVSECIEQGIPLVIEKVEEMLNPILMPLLITNLTKYGNEQPCIKFCEMDIPYNSNFRLFFSTLKQNPKFSPEITSRTNVIDFTVQQKGLEETLLDVIITNDKFTLEFERVKLSTDIVNGYRTLDQLETSILRILTETTGTLLDHGLVMESLENNKAITLSANDTLQAQCEAYSNVIAQRQHYISCATSAAILFFIQTQLQNLDLMYHFSLDSYIQQFKNSVQKSAQSQVLNDRLAAIKELHIINFYKKTIQALYRQDKLSFAFLFCLKLMEIEGHKISQYLLDFLAQDLNIKFSDTSEIENPSFVRLPDHVWRNITKLEANNDSFHGLRESFIENTEDWRNWFINSDRDEDSPLFGKFETLNPLERLVLITCLRPDHVVINVRRFLNAHLLGRHRVSEQSSTEFISSLLENRLLLLLPGRGVDLTSGLEQLAQATFTNVHLVCPGQGQLRLISNALNESSTQRDCIIIIDGHLAIDWLSEFEHIVDNWKNKPVDSSSRCWLSSASHSNFPIAIIQRAEKICVDRPEGMRSTIKHLTSVVPKDVQLNDQTLLQIATLHAILLQRSKLIDSLGWHCNYDFCDNDFLTCCKMISIAPMKMDNKNHESIKLMAANLAYGGRVSESWDQKLLDILIREIFHPSETKSIAILEEIKEEEFINKEDNEIQTPSLVQPEHYGLNHTTSAFVHFTESCEMQQCLKRLFISTPLSNYISSAVTTDNIEQVICTYKLIKEILPDPIDIKKFKRSLVIQRSMELVLLAEIEFYNTLLGHVTKDILYLRSAMKGSLEWSPYYGTLFDSIVANIVPLQWITLHPIEEEKNLINWCQNLSRKISKLQEWSAQLEPPQSINLAILHSPHAFLSALMQMNVSHLTDLDDMEWTFTIEKAGSPINELSSLKDGCVLKGIRLEGAMWNEENNFLMESTLNIYCPMPNIAIKCQRKSNNTSLEGMYNCPCYRDTRRSIQLFSISLNPGSYSPEHWVIRSVALIINL